MRALLLSAALLTFGLGAMPAGAVDTDPQVWIAICRGQINANYRQFEGGQGVFNQGIGGDQYQSLAMHQTSLKPGHVICSAAKGSEHFAQVCADNDRQIIFLKQGDPKHPKAPMKERYYCDAAVKIH